MTEGPPQQEAKYTNKELLARLKTKQDARELLAVLQYEINLWKRGSGDAFKAMKEAQEKPKYPWPELIADLHMNIREQEAFVRTVQGRLGRLPEK